MSDVSVKASKKQEGKARVTVEFEGRLPPAKWAEVKEKVRNLAKHYGLTLKKARKA